MAENKDGRFKKGEPRPAGPGRPPGVKNKRSSLLAEALEEMNVDLVRAILGNAQKLPPKEQADILVQLLPYRYPKLTSVEVSLRPPVPPAADLKQVSDSDLEAILVNGGEE